MSTTTVLVVIGFGVLVKTAIFVALVVRRDRRRRASDERAAVARRVALESAAPEPERSPWRLQWSEPGVLLVENAGSDGPALDVVLTATLQTAEGASAAVEDRERFVGAGGFFEARFAELEAELLDAATAMLRGQAGPAELECRLTWSLRWRGVDGRDRSASRTDEPVLPVPELALDGV